MKQFFWRIVLGLALALAACALYWGQLLSSQRSQLQYAEEQISYRATRLAETLALQVDTLLSGLEYLANSLAVAYVTEGGLYFPIMLQTAMRTFPEESLVQVSVVDASGDLVYSSLRGIDSVPNGGEKLGTIADREHFTVHLNNPSERVYVSRPVFGRLSQRWTIQISHAIRRDGQFLGVVVLSVAPSYISGYFREVFTSPGDTAALLYQDGTYMARSSREAFVMDMKVPEDNPILQQPNAVSGEFRMTPAFDPVDRLYAWHRVADYPLVVGIGLDRDAGLSTLKHLQRTSLMHSLLGSLVFLVFAGWVAWLIARLKYDHLRLEASERQLKEDAKLREALFDNSAADILLIHPGTRKILSSNRRANQTFSRDGQPLVDQSEASLHTAEEHARRFQSIYAELKLRGAVQVEAPLRNAEGQERWFSINGTLLDRDNPDGDVIWTMLDITQRRQMEQSLADAWVRLTQVIEHFPGGVLVEDEAGKVLVINQMFCDLFSLGKEAATVMGQHTVLLADSLGPEDAALLRSILPIGIDETEPEHFTTELLYRDRVLHINVIRVRRKEINRGRLWMVEDVTARVKHESDLNRMATTDALTGLPNRAAFLSRLELELRAAPLGERRGVLMMADLDRFKLVNDTYGHAAGDDVLCFLSDVFQRALRKTDMAGRLGGEEFSILMPDADEKAAWQVAERIRTMLENSEIPTSAGIVRITVSIGMADLNAGDAAAILAAADAALYKAKRSGRNRVEAAWENSLIS
ncbi:diguanylate cyclase [Pusillimonas sp. CC-YST705]|uniref:diguanylate cyclase n=1 Tax=Mesopusillimonas faecipullorum TaxID=2755040 RepID=A0ABS8C8K3_9BURK|nr:diguanylate cyclase [Mesopusillimonas faecipullorum]MCB5362363.1 diguanylate cyclase [Mesopusillimonas faecipullorum]